jgi:hypothetical protein
LLPENRHRLQKRKNLALLAVLVTLIILVYAITLMKMSG